MNAFLAPADAAFDAAWKRLTDGSDDSLQAGRALLETAARAGSGAATAKLAHFLAAGVAGPADWDGAVALLAEAAAHGFEPALAELRLLSGRDFGAAAELARAVDIRRFVAPRPTTTVSAAPRIRTLPGFMSPAECRWLIDAAATRLKPARVYDPAREGAQTVSARSNSVADLTLLETDVALVFLHARIAHSIGLPMANFEPSSVLHYSPGQEFLQHVDYLDSSRPGYAEELNRRGQRVATFLVYLNDGYEGGETDFPRLPFRFKGGVGDALVFANVDPSLVGDPRTLHAGLPPTSGEKWLLSQWIRNRPQTGTPE